MSKRKLIYADEARRAILETDPRMVFCIDKIKAVDAVEVLRCKNCRFWADGVEGCTDDEKCCKIGYYMTKGNDYCAYGKRKLAE